MRNQRQEFVESASSTDADANKYYDLLEQAYLFNEHGDPTLYNHRPPVLLASRPWNEDRVVQLQRVFQSSQLDAALVVIQDMEEPGIDGKPAEEQPPEAQLQAARAAKEAFDSPPPQLQPLISIVTGNTRAHMYTIVGNHSTAAHVRLIESSKARRDVGVEAMRWGRTRKTYYFFRSQFKARDDFLFLARFENESVVSNAQTLQYTGHQEPLHVLDLIRNVYVAFGRPARVTGSRSQSSTYGSFLKHLNSALERPRSQEQERALKKKRDVQQKARMEVDSLKKKFDQGLLSGDDYEARVKEVRGLPSLHHLLPSASHPLYWFQ